MGKFQDEPTVKKSIDGKTFGERLQELRIKSGFSSVQAFATAIKYAKSTVSRWETGEAQPSVKILMKIAVLLETNLDYLLTGVDSENTKASAKYGLSNDALNVLTKFSQPKEVFTSWARQSITLRTSDFIDHLLTLPQLETIAEKVLELQLYKAYMEKIYPSKPKSINTYQQSSLITDYELAAIRGLTTLSTAETAKYKETLIQREVIKLVRQLTKMSPTNSKQVDDLYHSSIETLSTTFNTSELSSCQYIELEEDEDEY